MLKKALKAVFVFTAGLIGLSLAVVSVFYLYSFVYDLSHEQDISSIKEQYIAFHSALSEKSFGEAYRFMTPQYRQTNSLDEFQNQFASSGQKWLSLEPGCYISIDGVRAELYPRKSNWLELWCGPLYNLEKINEAWYFTGDYDWYYD